MGGRTARYECQRRAGRGASSSDRAAVEAFYPRRSERPVAACRGTSPTTSGRRLPRAGASIAPTSTGSDAEVQVSVPAPPRRGRRPDRRAPLRPGGPWPPTSSASPERTALPQGAWSRQPRASSAWFVPTATGCSFSTLEARRVPQPPHAPAGVLSLRSTPTTTS